MCVCVCVCVGECNACVKLYFIQLLVWEHAVAVVVEEGEHDVDKVVGQLNMGNSPC